jgi:hypothetical protein
VLRGRRRDVVTSSPLIDIRRSPSGSCTRVRLHHEQKRSTLACYFGRETLSEREPLGADSQQRDSSRCTPVIWSLAKSP